jgi:hypothetical protein
MSVVLEPDVTVLEPDVTVLEPDVAALEPDAAVFEPDAARYAGNATIRRTESSPSMTSTLYVVALTAAVAILAGLVLWASMANPGMYPFSP